MKVVSGLSRFLSYLYSQSLRETSANRIVVDCGSHQTKIYFRGKLVWNQHTTLSFQKETQEFVSFGTVAHQQLMASQGGEVKRIQPIVSGSIADLKAVRHYLSSALNSATWVDGSELSRSLPIDIVVRDDLSKEDRAQWELLSTQLDRFSRIRTDVLVLQFAHAQLTNPIWVLDFGYSHTQLYLVDTDGSVRSQYIAFGVAQLLSILKRTLISQDIRVSQDQLEKVLFESLGFVDSSGGVKNRKLSIAVQQVSTAKISQKIIDNRDISQLLTKAIDRWLWMIGQGMIVLFGKLVAEKKAPQQMFCYGGGNQIRGLQKIIENTLLVESVVPSPENYSFASQYSGVN